MTDVHLGPRHPLHPLSFPEERANRFQSLIDEININQPDVDLVLITGDVVEKGDGEKGVEWFNQFINIVNRLRAPIKVYIVPGNHEWYRGWAYGRGDLTNYNNLVNNYFMNVIRFVDRNYLIYPNNYTFDYKGYLFIGLDSGYDYPVWRCGPGGSGLTNEQMNKLQDLDPNKPKIIFMHHPAIDDPYYPPWCDVCDNCPHVCDSACLAACRAACGLCEVCSPDPEGKTIKNNREEFIHYAINNNIEMVLTGHTHADRIYDGYERRVSASSTERPLFIQTPSAVYDDNNCRHGYRVLKAGSDGVTVHAYNLMRSVQHLKAEARSPVHIHVYDAHGRHTGINLTTGEPEMNMPRSFYLRKFTYEIRNETTNETFVETFPEMISMYDITQDYMIKVTANLTEEEKLSPEIETFNLTLRRQTNDSLTIISYFSVPIYENTTASVNFNMTTTNYTMCIDYDGDGNVDDLREPDSIDIDYAPDVRIISPQNNSHFLEGEKITFKGEGIDPEDGILTNDSLMWHSNINGAIGAGNEINASLSPGMHHITLLAKDSSDQIKTYSITIFVRSTQPDMFVDILSGNETPKVGEEHESIVEVISNCSYNFTIYIKNTGYGTLNNVSLVTNVSITKDVGDIEEGGERFVHIRFTPTQPGILTLKVTIKSKEIERNATRGLIINHFPLIIETDKDIYMQGETVMITTNTTNENPEVSYVDLVMNVTIQGPNIIETYDRPLLYIGGLESQNVIFTWDTTRKPLGNYIVTARILENTTVLSEASTSFVIASEVSVPLYTGWNMISLPLRPDNLSASSVLGTIPNAGGIAYLWNASKGAYDAIYGDMELEPGRAYWVSVTGDGTWTPTGSEILGTKANLTPGWNMIGVPSAANVSVTDTTVTVGADTYTLVEAAQNGYIGGIFYSWNTANREWDATIISDTAVLKPGIGYFANVNQECAITYP